MCSLRRYAQTEALRFETYHTRGVQLTLIGTPYDCQCLSVLSLRKRKLILRGLGSQADYVSFLCADVLG